MSWEHFSFDEFTCQCGCDENMIEASFVNKLDAMREELGFPFVVSSGYRCPEYNNNVSSTGWQGPHTTGKAVDILVDRGNAFEVISAAKKFGFTGIGVKQKGNNRFIHLDDLSGDAYIRPTVWGY